MKNATRGAASPSRPAAVSAALVASWPEEIHQVLSDLKIRQVAYVPDSGHARLIELARADRSMRAVPLTTEEEGVALAVGAWLGGEKSVLLLQSSGVGNCINMLATIEECRVPLLMLVTMRGQWGEFNPWQVPMAQGAAPSLTAMGVVVQTVDDPHDVASTIAAAARLAFNTSRAVAVLIGQRVIGAKEFGK
jgi:sulfopyruvate decarboxylase alpha subunit